MSIWRQFAALVLASSLLLSVACKKKKPQLPPQGQAPTVGVAVPEEISETTPPPPPPPKQEVPVAEPQKPKSQPKRRKKPTQPPPASSDTTAATGAGTSTVAAAHPPPNPADAPAPDTAIAAEVTSDQVNHQKQTTAELLDATEKNLKSVNHKLNHDEQGMVSQIKTYINQSRKATSENDFERAYNLATKARLLSDALVKK